MHYGNPFLSFLSPRPDFILLSPGPDFIKVVRVRILSILSPGSDFIKVIRPECESGSGVYHF